MGPTLGDGHGELVAAVCDAARAHGPRDVQTELGPIKACRYVPEPFSEIQNFT